MREVGGLVVCDGVGHVVSEERNIESSHYIVYWFPWMYQMKRLFPLSFVTLRTCSAPEACHLPAQSGWWLPN
jgi:hypothetical protein